MSDEARNNPIAGFTGLKPDVVIAYFGVAIGALVLLWALRAGFLDRLEEVPT